MKNWIKRLFCMHEYSVLIVGNKRYSMFCHKCMGARSPNKEEMIKINKGDKA